LVRLDDAVLVLGVRLLELARPRAQPGGLLLERRDLALVLGPQRAVVALERLELRAHAVQLGLDGLHLALGRGARVAGGLLQLLALAAQLAELALKRGELLVGGVELRGAGAG